MPTGGGSIPKRAGGQGPGRPRPGPSRAIHRDPGPVHRGTAADGHRRRAPSRLGRRTGRVRSGHLGRHPDQRAGRRRHDRREGPGDVRARRANARVYRTGIGQLTGLQLAPAGDAQPAAPWQPPTYADPDSFDEHDLTLGSGPLAAPGTLSLPQEPGPLPALVVLAGSGRCASPEPRSDRQFCTDE